MEKNSYFCDHCDQPVEIEGFSCSTDQGVKRFCCEGCLSIYVLLHPQRIVKNNNSEEKSRESL